MRHRHRQSANFTNNTIYATETAHAKAEAAMWLIRLQGLSIPLDDSYFAFLGWCAGGLKNLSRRLQESANALSGRRNGILQAKKAVANLNNYSEKNLEHALEALVGEHPVLLDMIQESIMQTLHDVIAHSGPENSSSMTTQHRIKKLFGLCEESMKLCRLAFMIVAYRAIENYIENCLQIQEFGNRRLMADMLDIPALRCQEHIAQMTNMGILEISNCQIRLCDSLNEAWQRGDAQSLQNTFCQPIRGISLPPEQFHIPTDDKGHVLHLLRQSHTAPVHILLYGPPGTGKTSFARSLAATLKVRAWAVPCKGKYWMMQDRMTSLTACLHLASRHEGAFVLVDEAERLLDTAVSTDGSSSSKAWLNDFLERKNQRIIWICNAVGHLDQAVRRRFSYSVHFEALGRRERRALWEDIAQRQNVTKRLSSEKIVALAEQYPVQAAVIESAVRQAKTIAKGKDFPACVERVLKAHTTLSRNGYKLKHKEKSADGYSLDAVCTEQPLETLLTHSWRLDTMMRENTPLKPGMATMLFYGPPGTGKTALAKHLAHVLDRECLVQRASDLLSPYTIFEK